MNAIDRLDQAAYEMYNALSVVILDSNINSFLSNYDPKALQQARDAVQVYLNRNDKEWMANRYSGSSLGTSQI